MPPRSAEMDKDETLAWLRRISGDLATATIKRLEESLPWYADMPPARRSAVGLVAQAGITSFIQWYDDPGSTPWIASDIFAAAPRELLRSVSLQQTLQLIRATVEVTEERVAGKGEDLREGILLYSREVAFAAADVYARAAEARGLWDARLEALVVDSILTGEADEELPSRIAALGWHGHGEVAVLVGTTPAQFDVDQLRRTARKLGVDVLIGVQGSRLVLVIGRAEDPVRTDEGSGALPFVEIAKRLEPGFGAGHLVLGPAVPALLDASQSAMDPGRAPRRREPREPKTLRSAIGKAKEPSELADVLRASRERVRGRGGAHRDTEAAAIMCARCPCYSAGMTASRTQPVCC